MGPCYGVGLAQVFDITVSDKIKDIHYELGGPVSAKMLFKESTMPASNRYFLPGYVGHIAQPLREFHLFK